MTHQTGNFLVPQHSGEPETKPKKIRCRQCGKTALENLVICPYCGRELYPAAPRWLMWGAPAALVLLFLIVVTTWGQTNPVTWTANQVSGGRTLLTSLVQRIEPRLVSGNPTAAEAALETGDGSAVNPAGIVESEDAGVEVIQISPETATPAFAQAQPIGINGETPTLVPTVVPGAATGTGVASEVAMNTALPTNTPEPTLTTEPTLAETATETPTRASSLAQLLTPSPASTSAPLTGTSGGTGTATTSTATNSTSGSSATATDRSSTRTATATANATATPTATPTAPSTQAPSFTPTAAAPLTYEIQAGDTLLAIANQFGITVDELMEANQLTQNDVLALRPGQELIIPSESAAPGSGQSSGTSPQQPQTYVVQSGDTPSSIANRFGVSVDALLTVNGLSPSDATRLSTGQVLIIPDSSSDAGGSSGASASAGASSAANTTTTEAATAASAPPAESQNSEGIRVDAPVLRTPQDGESLQCSRSNSLVWNPTPFITLQDNYVLHLGYVSAFDGSGDAEVQWVLAQQSDSTRTSWEMDSEFCSLAPQELGRQWRWYVEVVNESGVSISPPSEIWAFTWN